MGKLPNGKIFYWNLGNIAKREKMPNGKTGPNSLMEKLPDGQIGKIALWQNGKVAKMETSPMAVYAKMEK